MTLTQGQIIQSRYRVVALLAQGGMGAVYKAWDLNLNQPVAIKENLDTSPEAQRQFLREAQILSSLSHANLPRVTDHFFIAGLGQYLVMDFIEGEDLQATLDRLQRPLPEAQVLAWIDQVCDALEYLHAQNPPVIHRDVKPANIKIAPKGKAVLVDFGIAKIYDPHLATTIGAKAVTPGYSPPEQYGGGVTDARSDIYALGATLYTLLTGKTPPESVQRMVGGVTLTPPRQLNPGISPLVENAILHATEIATDRRFQRADEFSAALAQPIGSALPAGSGPSQNQPLSAAPRPIWIGVLMGLMLLAAGGALLALRPLPATPTPPVTAKVEVATVTARPATDRPVSPTVTSAPPVTAGHFIAYEAGADGNWQIYLADPATGQVWRLPGQPHNSTVPAWLPDGGHIAFRSDTSGNWQIYTLKIDGSDLQQITSGAGNNYEPNYAPDGSRIVFVSDRDSNKEIYVMDSNGRNQQRLTYNGGIDDDPNWSPDGNWLAFESHRNNRTDVYRMRPDGSEQTRLTSAGKANSTPAWSPDGRWLAFEREEGSVSHLWIMDANGRDQRQITFDGTYNVRPAWSAGGFELAYNSDRGGPVEVWIVPIDGSQSPLRISEGEGFDPAWAGL